MCNTKDGRCHIKDQPSELQASMGFNQMSAHTGKERSSELNSKDGPVLPAEHLEGLGQGGGVGYSVRGNVFRSYAHPSQQ